ncbi:MAG: hypothetical protein AB7G15_02275 [Alphaproteobacteria bacterium]
MAIFARFVVLTLGLMAFLPCGFANAQSSAVQAGWQSFRLDADGFAIDRPGTLVAVTPEAGRDEIAIHAEWRVPENRGTFYLATFPPLVGSRTLKQWADDAATEQGPAPVRQTTLPRDVPAVVWSWLEAGYYERRVAVHSGRSGRVIALLYAMETNAKTLDAAEREFKNEIDLQDRMAATIRLAK